MTHPFSAAGRRAALANMAAAPVDLLICGGGITGCGLAREAARRGLRVALVEQVDFAAGTSGRSSKLVHGGLRYLAYGEVGLVLEAARERRALRAAFPHLVHPLPFVIPLYRGESLTAYRAAFWLFDRLVGATPAEAHRILAPAEVRQFAPGLRDPLIGGVLYGEYLTDDARLTLANALDAAAHGALVANHAPVVALVRRGGRVAGARVRDALSGDECLVQARAVVNATGVWAPETLGLGGLAPDRPLVPSKGAHLLFAADRLPVMGAVALRSPAGVKGFAVRRGPFTYVGTTDTVHRGSLEDVQADGAAVEQLLALARVCFPDLDLVPADILGAWAGLRPLVAVPGRAPRDTSRRDVIWRSAAGLVTVTGGKLTTHRPMARRVLARLQRELGPYPRHGPTTTRDEPDVDGPELVAALARRGVPAPAAERVAWLYGGRARALLAYGDADPAWLEPLAPGVPALRGEVRLAVTQEMALTLADFLDRRSALLLFSRDRGLAAAEPAARLMAHLLGWSEAERAAQVAAYRRIAAAHGAAAGT